jgi:hypothetical protein
LSTDCLTEEQSATMTAVRRSHPARSDNSCREQEHLRTDDDVLNRVELPARQAGRYGRWVLDGYSPKSWSVAYAR